MSISCEFNQEEIWMFKLHLHYKPSKMFESHKRTRWSKWVPPWTQQPPSGPSAHQGSCEANYPHLAYFNCRSPSSVGAFSTTIFFWYTGFNSPCYIMVHWCNIIINLFFKLKIWDWQKNMVAKLFFPSWTDLKVLWGTGTVPDVIQPLSFLLSSVNQPASVWDCMINVFFYYYSCWGEKNIFKKVLWKLLFFTCMANL